MILFVLITALAAAETLLILAASLAWLGKQPPENAEGSVPWKSRLRAALSAVSPQFAAVTGGGKPPPGRALRLGLDLAEGCLLGMLLGLILMQLGFELLLRSDDLLAFFGAAGIGLAVCGARKILRALVAIHCAILMFIVYTPVSLALIRHLERSDTLRPVPAIVVLDYTLYPDGTMSSGMQARALQAYSLLRRGFAPRVLVARYRPEGSLADAMRAQMTGLGLDYPVEETGVGANTHDEACFTAEMARRRHWDTVILVTHPWHMRRAAATFEKAGLHVLCSPCKEGEYDETSVEMTHERLAAFRDWLHEVIGYQTYRARNWL